MKQPEPSTVFIDGEMNERETKMESTWDEWAELINEFQTYKATVTRPVTEQERDIVTGLIWLKAQLNHIGRKRVAAIVSGSSSPTDAERTTVEEFKALHAQATEIGLSGARLVLVKSVCECEIDRAFNSAANDKTPISE